MKKVSLLLIATMLGTGMLLADPEQLAMLRIEEPADSSRTTSARKPDGESARQIFATGIVEGAQRDIPLDFEIEGRLLTVEVAEGQQVRRGEILAQLDPELWMHRRHEAEAELQRALAERERLINAARIETRQVARRQVKLAEVNVAQALRELHRGEVLVGRKAISSHEWDNVRHRHQLATVELELAQARAAEVEADARQDEIDLADASVALARSRKDQAETMLRRTRLTAPCEGRILRIDAEPGQLVGPGGPQPLMTMANTDHLRVRAFVEEYDALSVDVGQSAWITADGRPNVRYAGTVISCAPYMVPKRMRHHKPGEMVDVKVRDVLIALDDTDDLVIGLRVDVYIVSAE